MVSLKWFLCEIEMPIACVESSILLRSNQFAHTCAPWKKIVGDEPKCQCNGTRWGMQRTHAGNNSYSDVFSSCCKYVMSGIQFLIELVLLNDKCSRFSFVTDHLAYHICWMLPCSFRLMAIVLRWASECVNSAHMSRGSEPILSRLQLCIRSTSVSCPFWW